jgi:hypothetical protein
METIKNGLKKCFNFQGSIFDKFFNGIVPLVFSILVVAFFLKVLLAGYSFITSPRQTEYRETANLTTINLLMTGENPYVIKNLPQYNNVYGILFYSLSAGLVKIFGHILLIPRLLIFLFLLAAWIFLAFVMKSLKINWLYCLAGVALMVAANMHSGDLMTRPDGLGFLFYLLVVFIPFLDNFSKKSLVFSLLISVLAFYTKAYFVFGAFYVASYLCLFVSKKRGLIYGLSFLLIILSSAMVVNHFFPFYFINTFFSLGSALGYNQNHMIKQLLWFVEFNPGLSILSLVAAVWFFAKWYSNKKSGEINFKNLDRPLLSNSMDYLAFCLILSLLVFIFYLGGNGGRILGYFYQLVVPILILFTFNILKTKTHLKKLVILALVILNLFIIVHSWWGGFEAINDAEQEQWLKVEQLIADHKQVLADPSVSYVLFMSNRFIYDNGQTEYFHWGGLNDAANKYFKNSRLVAPISEAYAQMIKDKIINKQFDLIILKQDDQGGDWFADSQFVSKYYNKKDSIKLRMFSDSTKYLLDIYEPK